MQKRRIAYLLHRFPVISETFIVDELMQLEREGMDVTVFSFERPTRGIMHKEAKELAEGVLYSLDPKSDLKSINLVLRANTDFLFRSPLKYINSFFKYAFKMGKNKFLQVFYLCSMAKRWKPEHLHAHFACLGATAAMIMSHFLKIPFSFTVHAHDIFVEDDFLKEKLKRAEHVIAISEYNKEYLLKKFSDIPPEKIKVIHCGVDTETFKPETATSYNTINILSGGRLVEKKGFIYLIKACRLLTDRGIKLRCYIFGDGPLMESLSNEVKISGLRDVIHFIGAVTRDELPEFLAKGDIFVSPSIIAEDGDREGIPLTLMEAMSCQKAVVSTNISGIAELVDSTESGVLVPEKDEQALARAIEDLLRKADLRKRLGLKAREKVARDFNLRKTASALSNLFENYGSESRGCNLCGADNATVISSHVSFDQVKYSHVRCKKCGLIYSSPMPRLDNGALDQMALDLWYSQFLFQSRQFYDQHFKRYQEHNRLRVEALEKYIKPGRLLEVGCGNAYFLAAARERGWEVRGVDVCRDLCRYVKEYLKLDIHYGTLEGAGFEDSYFDAVYLNNILEHVPDPAGSLKEVYRVLKDEGIIFTSVPDTKDLLDGLRRTASYLGLKGIWKGYLDPPMHLYAYSPRTLKMLLEKCGFRVLKLFTAGEGNKEYFPDFSKISFKKAINKSVSFVAIPLRKGTLLNAYAVKDKYGKV